jgi:putative transposase
MICDSIEILRQKFKYIHNNPVRAGIVLEQEHYLYSSAGNYAGLPGLMNISLLDLGIA